MRRNYRENLSKRLRFWTTGINGSRVAIAFCAVLVIYVFSRPVFAFSSEKGGKNFDSCTIHGPKSDAGTNLIKILPHGLNIFIPDMSTCTGSEHRSCNLDISYRGKLIAGVPPDARAPINSFKCDIYYKLAHSGNARCKDTYDQWTYITKFASNATETDHSLSWSSTTLAIDIYSPTNDTLLKQECVETGTVDHPNAKITVWRLRPSKKILMDLYEIDSFKPGVDASNVTPRAKVYLTPIQ